MIQLKLRINESNYLLEDIAAVKKYYPNIDDNTFMKLIQLDPTYRDGSNSVGKYGKWILNLYNRGTISEDDFGEITPLLNQFNTYKNRIQNKDLNAYKTLDDLDAAVSAVVDDDSMLSDRQKLRFKKNVKAGRVETSAENNYETAYEDSDWVVYVPHTHEASMKLGKGTEWCTAHENPDWYNTYTYDDGEEFSLFIMKNKSTGERFQYCDNYYQDTPFMDESDNPVDFLEFMDRLHEDGQEDFGNWLENLDPNNFQMFEDYDGIHIKNLAVIGHGDYVEPEISIPSYVERIDDSAMEDSDVEVVILPKSLHAIGTRAFCDCEQLVKVDFSNAENLVFIYDNAFYGCNSLYRVIIDRVEVIMPRAFAMCTDMDYITIDNGIKEICRAAFAGCNSVETAYIGDGSCDNLVIGDRAFAECTSLKSVIIGDSVSEIHKNAFFGCDLDKLTIYSDSEYVKKYCEENGIMYEER